MPPRPASRSSASIPRLPRSCAPPSVPSRVAPPRRAPRCAGSGARGGALRSRARRFRAPRPLRHAAPPHARQRARGRGALDRPRAAGLDRDLVPRRRRRRAAVARRLGALPRAHDVQGLGALRPGRGRSADADVWAAPTTRSPATTRPRTTSSSRPTAGSRRSTSRPIACAGCCSIPPRSITSVSVILEELAMYESDPWDALERRVQALLYGDHPYGRAVLGTTAELVATGADELRAFQREFYCPANAVLVIAGDVGEEALDAAERRFAELPSRSGPGAPAGVAGAARRSPSTRAPPRRAAAPGVVGGGAGVGRSAPRAAAPAHAAPDRGQVERPPSRAGGGGPALQLGGRRSRVLARARGAGASPPSSCPASSRSESRPSSFRVLATVLDGGLAAAELERARRTYEADWIFGHERIHQRALTLASALAHLDADFPERYLAAVLAAVARPRARRRSRGAALRLRRARLVAAGVRTRHDCAADRHAIATGVATPGVDRASRTVPARAPRRGTAGGRDAALALGRQPRRGRPRPRLGHRPHVVGGHRLARLARHRRSVRVARHGALVVRRPRGARRRARLPGARLAPSRSTGWRSWCSRPRFRSIAAPGNAGRASPSSRACATSPTPRRRGRSPSTSTRRTPPAGRFPAASRRSPASIPPRAADSTSTRSRAAASSPSPATSTRTRWRAVAGDGSIGSLGAGTTSPA